MEMKRKLIFTAALLCVTLFVPLSLFGQADVTDIEPGSSRSANLPSGGIHTYRVTVPVNETLVAYTEGGLDTFIRLFNASGMQIASDDDSGSGYNALVSQNVPAGTYTIQVNGYGSSSGFYTLYISPHRQAGTDIALGSSRNATLSVGDVHTYRVTVSGNTALTAYTTSSLDTYIRVFNASGAIIASDDDSGSELNASVNQNVSAGTYIIQVSCYGSSSGGSYTLFVSAPATATTRQYATVTFRNVTGETIYYLYISERTDDSWGADWLGSSTTLANNSTYTTRLLTGEYDVRATDLSGNTAYIFWIEVNPNGGTFSIDPSDRR
jgi:hypothetical protein